MELQFASVKGFFCLNRSIENSIIFKHVSAMQMKTAYFEKCDKIASKNNNFYKKGTLVFKNDKNTIFLLKKSHFGLSK